MRPLKIDMCSSTTGTVLQRHMRFFERLVSVWRFGGVNGVELVDSTV